jgi:type I restriction enzyme, S subunit
MNAVSKISAFPPTVQPGLPQLGILPNGWCREPIGNHLQEVRRPVSMTDADIYQLITAKRARGGIVEREMLSGREISVKSQFRIAEGDFVISKRQIVHGACGLVPRELDGAIVSNEYSVLRPSPSIDPRFLSYLTNSIYFQQTCFHSSIGVHIEKMIFKLDKWLKWEFDLPPLAEQKKIAEILLTWDQAIRATEKLLANAEAQKRALMQQLLTGKRRLKGFEGGEWVTREIGAISDTWSGGTPSRDNPSYYGGDIPWIKSGELNADTVTSTQESITQLALEHSSAKLVYPGTVLIAMYGATAGVISVSKITAAINQAILAVRPKENFDGAYLLHALDASMEATKRLTQGGQPNLNAGIIRATRIATPSLPEQKAIAEVIDTSVEILSAAKRKLRHLHKEKTALMQQLLTGKRRVTP